MSAKVRDTSATISNEKVFGGGVLMIRELLEAEREPITKKPTTRKAFFLRKNVVFQINHYKLLNHSVLDLNLGNKTLVKSSCARLRL